MRGFFLCIAFIAVISMSNYLSDESEREDEIQQVKIIKEAENSNDPVLKQKAENIKAEIYNQAKKIQEEEKQRQEIEALENKLGFQIMPVLSFLIMGIVFFIFSKVFRG